MLSFYLHAEVFCEAKRSQIYGNLRRSTNPYIWGWRRGYRFPSIFYRIWRTRLLGAFVHGVARNINFGLGFPPLFSFPFPSLSFFFFPFFLSPFLPSFIIFFLFFPFFFSFLKEKPPKFQLTKGPERHCKSPSGVLLWNRVLSEIEFAPL